MITQENTMNGQAQSFTPAEMLPVEILLTVIPLTRPSSTIPLASRLFAALLDFPPSTVTSDPSKSMCFDWLRRRLSESTDWACAGFLHDDPAHPENTRVPCLCMRCLLVELRPAVYWYPGQSGVDSCKGLVPARFKAALCDTWVVRKSFVDSMLDRCWGLDEKQLVEELSLLGSPADSNRNVGARYLPESPFLDMLFLATFYLRSRNIDLLGYTLTQLDAQEDLSQLADIELPLNCWSNLSAAIDDPEVAGELYHYPIESSETIPAPFSHFLLTLAACQWSVPLVSVICDALDMHPAHFVDWPHFHSEVFNVMLTQLTFVPKYLSPGAMCRWLRKYGFEPDSESHYSIAGSGETRSHFLDLYFEHDEGYLHLIKRRSEEHHHLHWRCEEFGMTWLLKGDRLDGFDSADDSDDEKWLWD